MNNDLDWGNLSFGYIPTDYNVRCYFRDGKWGEIEVSQSEEINLHIAPHVCTMDRKFSKV